MSITSHLPRYPLAFLPTPLHPLPRLSEQLAIYFELPADGFQLWIKRDDQTGLATGGNKTRKLEFLVADALAQGADTFLTVGAPVQPLSAGGCCCPPGWAGMPCDLDRAAARGDQWQPFARPIAGRPYPLGAARGAPGQDGRTG